MGEPCGQVQPYSLCWQGLAWFGKRGLFSGSWASSHSDLELFPHLACQGRIISGGFRLWRASPTPFISQMFVEHLLLLKAPLLPWRQEARIWVLQT